MGKVWKWVSARVLVSARWIPYPFVLSETECQAVATGVRTGSQEPRASAVSGKLSLWPGATGWRPVAPGRSKEAPFPYRSYSGAGIIVRMLSSITFSEVPTEVLK